MSTPFAALPTLQRWILLLLLLVSFILLGAALKRQGEPLRNEAAPRGILSYEFAWTRERAAAILTSWDTVTAKDQLYLDFPFLMVYPLLLSLVCAMLSAHQVNPLSTAGAFISWCVLAAAPLDAAENWALLRMVDHGPHSALAGIAGAAATVKFALVFAALAWVPVQLVALLLKGTRGT